MTAPSMRHIITLAIAIAMTTSAQARDPSQRAEFHRYNPCPSTGSTAGACHGYEVDHRRPLAAGGADRPSNMQWLSVPEHRAKTRHERQACVYGCSSQYRRSHK